MAHDDPSTTLTTAVPADLHAPSPATARSGRRLLLLSVAMAQFVVSLDITVVNIALPAIRTALDFSVTDVVWVINAYALTFGGLLLLGGRLADLIGLRRVLLGALAAFGLVSLLGGLAQTSGELVAARALQGVAAAALAPAALALLTVTFHEQHERARALAVWAAVSALGAAVGLLVGGVLTEFVSWRWVLLINVPIAAGTLLAGARAIPTDGPIRRGRPDTLGALLATVGMALLALAVVRTDHHPWGSATTLLTLALAVLLLAAFALVEVRLAREPLLRLAVFANRAVSGATLAMLLLSAGQLAAFYFVSQQVQIVLGYGAATTGLAFLPFCIGIIVASIIAMRALPRYGPRPLLAIGAPVSAAGMLWFSHAGPDATFLGSLLGLMLLASIGLGLCFVPATAAATQDVAHHEAGMLSGILNSARQVGGAIGLAALVAVAAAHRTTRLDEGASQLAAFSDAQQHALVVTAALIIVAGLCAALLPARPSTATAA